jgi:hypothetical protein
MVWRELALAISLVSLGSSQILRFPQPTTEAARRFCVVRLTLLSNRSQHCGRGYGGEHRYEDACKEGSPHLESLMEQKRESKGFV